MNKLLLIPVLALAVAGGYRLMDCGRLSEGATLQNAPGHPSKTSGQKQSAGAGNVELHAWGYSPFGPSPATSFLERKTHVSERMEKMRKAGLKTPEKYFSMPLKTLQELGKEGDVFALLQLGQQFWDENATLEQDPDYDFTVNPKVLASRYMNEAFLAGYNHAALVLAERLAQQSPTDGYTWALVAQQFGDKDASQLLQTLSHQLSSKQSQEAQLAAMNKNLEVSKLWREKLYPAPNPTP
jgi:hypothetical protein